MRLVRQTRLFYQKGNSDKVYEVDLCEAGEGEFIVNFRYGRRDARLREGTKTPFPESLSRAETIYLALVEEKVKKGYLVGDESGAPVVIPEVEEVPQSADRADDPRVLALLTRLDKGRGDHAWSLSRVLWKVGQWRLKEALPRLRVLCGEVEGMEVWCVAWALGRCGESEDLALLDQLERDHPGNLSLSAIIAEARFALASDDQKASLAHSLMEGLPDPLGALLEQDNLAELTSSIRQMIESGAAREHLISDLYLVAVKWPLMREALYSVAKNVDTTKHGMLVLRQLFKAAEFRLDAEIYGVIARRFESDAGNGHGYYDYEARQFIRSAFSTTTKKYFKRRIWRHLKKAGEADDAATYVPLAMGILLAYDDRVDSPEESSFRTAEYNAETRRYENLTVSLPAYAQQNSFVYILHGASRALQQDKKKLNWQYSGEERLGDTRNEMFPHFWDEAPEAIFHLLAQARSQAVQDFALRLWKDHTDWAEKVEISFVLQIVSSWYAPTAELGMELAREKWNPEQPNEALLLALLDSESEQAQDLGVSWLVEIQSQLDCLPNLVASLLFLRRQRGRLGIVPCFATLSLSRKTQKDVLARAVSALLSLSESEEDADCARFVVSQLRNVTKDELSALPQMHIAELAAHPLESLQLLAVELLMAQGRLALLPETLLLAALSSTHGAVRRRGLDLLDTLSDLQLAERAETLANCAISQHGDLREHVRPLISRITGRDREFSRDLVQRWYPLLLRKELVEGIHTDLYHMLSGPLRDDLGVIPEGSYVRMLESVYAQAQALGFLLLKDEANLSQTSLVQLIAWADHAHAELREHIWDYFQKTPSVITDSPGDAVKLLETNWVDSSEAAMQFFRHEIREEHWSADALVAMCDSVKPEVQDFGREMITKRFQDQDGPQYLAQLSQHPSTELQVFASHYLMRYAVEQPERIALLEPYFRTVLSKIGAGRTAKQRIFELLEQESLKHEPTAKLVGELLTRISATIAIGDKAVCIQLLHSISQKWPELSHPLVFTSPPVWSSDPA